MIAPGDRVVLPGTTQPSALVKSVSAGGTVTLKSALGGRRCFAAHELDYAASVVARVDGLTTKEKRRAVDRLVNE